MWLIEELYPCLTPLYQAVIVDTWFADPARLYTMTGGEWGARWLLQGIGEDDALKRAFEGAFYVSFTDTGLPFPFNVLVSLDDAVWEPIYDYGDATDFSATQADCDFFAFKGSQGGAWPVLWP